MKSPLIDWRNTGQHYHLTGQQCTSCKKIFFPRTYICTCEHTTFIPYKLSGHGAIVSFTEVTTSGPEFGATTPYILALIDLDEGVRMLGQLTDSDKEKLYIGAHVVPVFRRLYADGEKGIIHYGTKFLLDQA
ncbi:MAG: Zn-ribbon domain-containing OB-fold protein [Candidatus Babeliales bacterium]|jgi:hypothetical protein